MKVIFACVHSAGRSQMAAAFFNAAVAPGEGEGISAGTQPAERVHPEVVTVMAEKGIDVSAARPRLLTFELARDADLIVTMGCGDSCPVVPGVRREDWVLTDPKGQPLPVVRRIRDEIEARVRALLVSSSRPSST